MTLLMCPKCKNITTKSSNEIEDYIKSLGLSKITTSSNYITIGIETNYIITKTIDVCICSNCEKELREKIGKVKEQFLGKEIEDYIDYIKSLGLPKSN
jgi:hypothetical protein